MSKASHWTSSEEATLWQLHKQHGNKWTVIAASMPSRNDAAIKNKFYSTIRKGLRKLNKYVTQVKKKSDPLKFKAYKPLQELFVVKLIAVSDNKHDEKYQVKPDAFALAHSILPRMIEVACNEHDYDQGKPENYPSEEELLSDILEFNRNCKRRKGKKVDDDRNSPAVPQKEEEDSEEEQMSEKEEGSVKEEVVVRTSLPSGPQKVKSAFQMGVQEFMVRHQKLAKEEDGQAMSKSTNLSQSNSWVYDSVLGTSRELAKKFTEPSPLPSDDKNPFSFASIVKNRNITASNMFDLRSSMEVPTPVPLADKDKEGKTISIVDQLPLVPQERTTEFFKSTDLSRSMQLSEPEKESPKLSFSPPPQDAHNQIISNPFSSFSEYCFNPVANDEEKGPSFPGKVQ